MNKHILAALTLSIGLLLANQASARVFVDARIGGFYGGYYGGYYAPYYGYPAYYAYPGYYYSPPPTTVVYAQPAPTTVVQTSPTVYAQPAPAVQQAPLSTSYVPPTAAQPPTASPIADSYTDSSGRTCRQFQSTALISGSPQPMYGTACLQPDGSWRSVQ